MNQNPHVLHRASLSEFFSHLHSCSMQHLGLAELHSIHMGLVFKLVQVLLDGITSFCYIRLVTQLDVVSKPAEVALSSTI